MTSTTPATLRYVVGDITAVRPVKRTLLVHCCNDVGRYGAGVAAAIAARWPEAALAFYRWARGELAAPYALGMIQPVRVSDTLTVINAVAQSGLATRTGPPPIRYEALTTCLEKVAQLARAHGARVIAPKLGAGLARGDWTQIAILLDRTLVQQQIPVQIIVLDARDIPTPPVPSDHNA